MSFKFNPFTGNFDIDTNTGGSSSVTIPEYSSDPASPNAGDAWVLKSGSAVGGGEPIGLLLALTTPGTGGTTYQLSYRTNEATTIRVSMT